MRSLSANNGNIKSVMRTALVGIKPADQVMLKGYLRVLLRLEADLEWVSANHPEVDLFMINNDFRQATNVIKLLQANANKPVLYIGQADQGADGYLTDDLLILPLKDMQMLSRWLFLNVKVLQNKNTDVLQKNSNENRYLGEASSSSVSSVNLDQKLTHDSIKKEQNYNFDAVNDSNTQLTSHKNDTSQNSSILLKIIQDIRSGISGKYELSANNEVFAIIEPSKALVWTKKSTLSTINNTSFDQWKIAPSLTTPSLVAHDLKQWLWDISKENSTVLYPFIYEAKKYRLSYWVKPTKEDNRSDLLRIMTAIETEANTPTKISEVSGVAITDVKAILARLFLGGYLYPDNYEGIDIEQSPESLDEPVLASKKVPLEDHEVGLAQPSKQVELIKKEQENLSPFEAVLAKRAAGIPQDVQTSSSIPSLSTNSSSHASSEPKHLRVKPEKKGFLSRLRKKFGL